MLFVQTNNCKQKNILQQQFSRQGNLFAIPIRKTSQIHIIIKTILFEVFGQLEHSTEQKNKPMNKLINKFMEFFQNILKLKFSLSIIREIFDIVKIDAFKLKQYEQYFCQMDRRFNKDQEDYVNQFEGDLQNFGKGSLGQQLFEQYRRKENGYNIMDTEFLELEYGQKLKGKQIEQDQNKDKNQNISISCRNDSPVNQDAQTMHTLRSQFVSNSKFTLARLTSAQMNIYKIGNNKLQNSFQQDESKSQEYTIINLKDQAMTSDKNTNNLFYCPEWKKNQQQQRKLLKNIISTDTATKKSGNNDSNYIDNLSGRVHPVPSFLHNDSLGQIIVKQKKEDARKSSILRKSIIGADDKKNSGSQHAYTSNLRLIKYHNKIRKNSKKCLSIKSSLQNQQDIPKQDQIPLVINRQMPVRYNSQTNLSKVCQQYQLNIKQNQLLKKEKQKQKSNSKEKQKKHVNIKTESNIKLIKDQLKQYNNEATPTKSSKGIILKGFNFFKSKKQ